MDLSTRIKHRRGFGEQLLAAALVFLLCACTLAAGSSALHEKLHSDHSSPTHACLLSTLEHGTGIEPTDCSVIVVQPELPVFVAASAATAWASVELRQFSGRGPPCLS
jgi:hypothetical protein